MSEPTGTPEAVTVETPVGLPTVIMGGYDKTETDKTIHDYRMRVATLKTRLDRNSNAYADLQTRCRQLEAANTQLTHDLQEARRDAEHAIVGLAKREQAYVDRCRKEGDEYKSQAEEQAANIIAHARHEAGMQVGQAKIQAKQILDEAQQQAEQLVSAGRQDSAALLASAKASAEEIREHARRTVTDADRQAASMIDKARQEATRIEDDGQRNAKQWEVRISQLADTYNQYRVKLTELADALNTINQHDTGRQHVEQDD
ncbi:AsmA family/AsmA-like C-terminal region [Bifidobacterium animalis subsp. animalis]|nr:AsmA family/AsmA-like C-terminal region [Bifidobacterium animalis subsp. animalis]